MNAFRWMDKWLKEMKSNLKHTKNMNKSNNIVNLLLQYVSSNWKYNHHPPKKEDQILWTPRLTEIPYTLVRTYVQINLRIEGKRRQYNHSTPVNEKENHNMHTLRIQVPSKL